jgi:hypothetical protein
MLILRKSTTLIACVASGANVASRPNVLVILTNQFRYPPPYESDELRAHRRENSRSSRRTEARGDELLTGHGAAS